MTKKVGALSLLLLTASGSTHGQVLTFDFSGINQSIPDGNPTGLANPQLINSAPNLTIGDLNVSLTISGTGLLGGFNGDLYATLQHESGFAVLLNRPSRRSGSSAGYNDSGGIDVTFDDAASRDVHNYRLELNSSHAVPIVGSLTGTWSPDARDVDPAAVLDTSSRSAFLDGFIGLPINGAWALFVSDLSSGGTHQLDSWSMQVTPVPEPASVAFAGSLGLLAFSLWRRLQYRRS
jgi:hypothetical protein